MDQLFIMMNPYVKGPLIVSMQIFPFFDKLLQLLQEAKAKLLAFIGRLVHSEYILTLILEKYSCLYRDFNQFYEEGYVKFSVSENRSNF